jgi:rubrerythrin
MPNPEGGDDKRGEGEARAGVQDDDDFPRPPGQAELLLTLGRLDLEVAAAYDVIASEVRDEGVRTQLIEMRDDHRRHVDELQSLLSARGTDAAVLAELQGLAGPQGLLLRPLAELVRPLGSGFAIVTLIANEHVTNASYEAALEYDWSDDEIEFLDRAFLDEQDHLEWLLAQETVLMGEGDEAAAAARPDVPA